MGLAQQPQELRRLCVRRATHEKAAQQLGQRRRCRSRRDASQPVTIPGPRLIQLTQHPFQRRDVLPDLPAPFQQDRQHGHFTHRRHRALPFEPSRIPGQPALEIDRQRPPQQHPVVGRPKHQVGPGTPLGIGGGGAGREEGVRNGLRHRAGHHAPRETEDGQKKEGFHEQPIRIRCRARVPRRQWSR
jgi:hypothetical protein